MDYEAIWKLAQKQGREKAAMMWPPHLTATRLRAEYEYTLEFYRQMTTPPAPTLEGLSKRISALEAARATPSTTARKP